MEPEGLEASFASNQQLWDAWTAVPYLSDRAAIHAEEGDAHRGIVPRVRQGVPDEVPEGDREQGRVGPNQERSRRLERETTPMPPRIPARLGVHHVPRDGNEIHDMHRIADLSRGEPEQRIDHLEEADHLVPRPAEQHRVLRSRGAALHETVEDGSHRPQRRLQLVGRPRETLAHTAVIGMSTDGDGLRHVMNGSGHAGEQPFIGIRVRDPDDECSPTRCDDLGRGRPHGLGHARSDLDRRQRPLGRGGGGCHPVHRRPGGGRNAPGNEPGLLPLQEDPHGGRSELGTAQIDRRRDGLASVACLYQTVSRTSRYDPFIRLENTHDHSLVSNDLTGGSGSRGILRRARVSRADRPA